MGASLDRRDSSLSIRYTRHLVGRVGIIAPQTVAELRYGALLAKWGERRRKELDRIIASVVIAPVDDGLVWAQAHLRTSCRDHGHPLASSAHAGDLWIAATAVHYDIPLVSHDGIFRHVPGLQLITELDDQPSL